MQMEKVFSPKRDRVYYVEIDSRKTKRNRVIGDLLEICADIFYIGAGDKLGQIETTNLNEARFWKDKKAAEWAGMKYRDAIINVKEMSTKDFVELIEPIGDDYVSKKNKKLLKSEKKYLRELDELLEPYVFKNHKVPNDWGKWQKCPKCNLRPLVGDFMKSTSCGCGEDGDHLFVSAYSSKHSNDPKVNYYYMKELRKRWNRKVENMKK